MSWLRLNQAATLIDHDVDKARERLTRAISKAWLVGPGVWPQLASDPNVPLRIQVIPSPGLRIDGRGWLEQPVLNWETSEIECLCKPWTPMGRPAPEPPTQCKAPIEVWEEDFARLWGGDNSASGASAEVKDNPLGDQLPRLRGESE
jgi:hypothetical protein